MQNYADQCLDLAQSILGHNLGLIQADGTLLSLEGEPSSFEEPGHAAFAIGEYYRATGLTQLGDYDLVDLAARCITAQVFMPNALESGLTYAALGLLSFGPSKDRNLVWERLMDETRKELDKQLLIREDCTDFRQAFNIAKSVARFSFGLSKKDETGKLIDKFIERVQQYSTGGFCDNAPERSLSGSFDIYGVLSFVLIRQSLQLHADVHLKDRKLPSLRTFAEKYLRLFPDLVRADGLGWAYGSGIGAYGQMHIVSLILQAMRDEWLTAEQMALYQDILRRLFLFFFSNYIDQEHGYLVVRDQERTTNNCYTTRIANFDAIRYLCQWARLAKAINSPMVPKAHAEKTIGRYVSFQKNHKREQGLFIYKDANSGLQVQIPLMAGDGKGQTSDYLAFPHAPGVFDWPTNHYLPAFLPELTFGKHVCIPSFYGKACTAGIGLKNTFFFKYEQPELITKDEEIVPGLGSCKVQWSFSGGVVSSEFLFTVKNTIQLDNFRYVIPVGAMHSHYRSPNSFSLGENGLCPNLIKDDFQCTWADTLVVTEDPAYRSYYGKIHYLQILERSHSLIMRPGQQYRLSISFTPDLNLS